MKYYWGGGGVNGYPTSPSASELVQNIFIYGETLTSQLIITVKQINHEQYQEGFMKNLSSDNQADVIKAFNLTSRHLDDLLNIDNPYFEGMVNQIYPPELQLNKANTSDTEAPF